MTYFEFHLCFLLPVILLLWLAGRKHQFNSQPKAIWSLLIIATIAFVYTTPWDNYLVKTGIWGYSDGRVLGKIGYVPIEEYAFFILQPLLTGLFLYYLMARQYGSSSSNPPHNSGTAHWIGTLVYTYLALGGMLLLQFEATRYLALILVWACPILAVQWTYGGDYLWGNKRLLSLACGLPTLYLWIADRIAIELEIWFISERFTTGLHLAGLPIEEAIFFLATNLLVVQGLMLSVYKWPAFEAYIRRRRFLFSSS